MPSPFKSLLIIDFETTCDGKKCDYPFEIIQFSVAVVDVQTKSLMDAVYFNEYVRPVINPILTDYCKEFTGIQQETVDKSETFSLVYNRFLRFLASNAFCEKTFAVVCDSRQDMFRIAQWQLRYSGIDMPPFFRQYVNLWRTFEQEQDRLGKKELLHPTNIGKMCEFYDIDFTGRAHDALADCKTLGMVVQRMLRDGATVTVNEELVCVAPWRRSNPLKLSADWKNDFKEAMKVFERFLPLVPSIVRPGMYNLSKYNVCKYCKNPATVCGKVHRQYPYDLYNEMGKDLEFARHVNYFK